MALNVLTISGNLTRDVEIKTTQSGKQVANFSIAHNKSKDSAFFLTCVAWEKTAELIEGSFKKGDKFVGTGELDIRKYQDNNGVEKLSVELIVRSFEFPPRREQSVATGGGHAMTSVHGPVDELEGEIPFMRLRSNEIAGW